MSPRVTHDPNHPDFPHGLPKGRSRGCVCTACRVAMSKQKKRAKLLATRYGTTKRITPEKQARVVAHIDHLMATVPGVSRTAVCRAAGVSHCALVGLDGARLLAPKTASAILAVTPAAVAEVAGFVPHASAVHHLRTMQALGYPITWQARQTGVMVSDLLREDWRYTTIRKAQKIAALAARVGDAPATPQNTGLPQRSLSKAATIARMAGFYPPACYNEDGTLDYRAIPDHPWSRADEEAHRRIAVLRLLLDRDGCDFSAAVIAERVGCSGRTVTRIATRLGLTMVAEGYAEAAADMGTLLDAFDSDMTDPVLFALDNGLMAPAKVPQSHPAFVAWWAEHPEYEPTRTRMARERRELREAEALNADAAVNLMDERVAA